MKLLKDTPSTKWEQNKGEEAWDMKEDLALETSGRHLSTQGQSTQCDVGGRHFWVAVTSTSACLAQQCQSVPAWALICTWLVWTMGWWIPPLLSLLCCWISWGFSLGFGPESWRLAMGGAEDTDQLQHVGYVGPLLDALSTVNLFFFQTLLMAMPRECPLRAFSNCLRKLTPMT